MPEISSFLNNVQLVVFVAMSAALAAMATGLWYERRQRMRNEKQVLDLKQEMLQHSHHDQLTGLPNRKFLLDVLPLRLKESNPFAFLYIKFPRAAEVRSSLGHDISDELTIAIVRRLKEVMDAQHFLARLSASSFAILYPADNPDMAMDKAQQIQRVLAKPYMLSGQEIQMISAIGVRHTNGGGDAMNVLRDAEIAMQNVQHKHIDAISVFESSMRAQLEMRYELETDLRRALYFETGQMKVAFQPIVSIKDEKLVGFEALARWQHPSKGFIPPDKFIHVAEETGMIVPLWNFILTESCRQLAGWLPFMPDGLRPTIAVNLSATQLNSPGLYRSLENALEITGLPPDLLKIEITESGLMLDYDVTGPLLEKIRTLGCSISIDDFGTGYSSLSYLLRLPVNDIKVDRSFIKVMHDTPINRELVRAIIDMGHLLHKKVVAEGVETAEDLTALRAMGCDHAQGYFFCKPMFAAQVPEYLQKFN